MSKEISRNNYKARELLIIAVAIIVGLYYGIAGFIQAKAFLAPLLLALLLTMILMPLCNFLENKGFNRILASLTAVAIALLFISALFLTLSFQIKQITEDWPQFEKRIEPKIKSIQQWIENEAGIKLKGQNSIIGENNSAEDSGKNEDDTKLDPGSILNIDSSDGLGILNSIKTGIFNFFSFSGALTLTLVYLFFMLIYRKKLQLSFQQFFPENKRTEASSIANEAVKIAQKYLLGRLFLILILIILYSIGLLIVGIEQAVLISILAAVLSLLPYLGNVIGFLLAFAMAVFSGEGVWAYVGIGITFGVAQFIENYFLEPYVVGRQVNLNPLMTIVVIVLGGMVWGFVGMIISIPVFGIFKIIFDRVEKLKPLGYLLGEKDADFKK